MAQRQASVCLFSVRAKFAVPGWQQAISRVAKEKTQQVEAEAASPFEVSFGKERQGGVRKDIAEDYSGQGLAYMGCYPTGGFSS